MPRAGRLSMRLRIDGVTIVDPRDGSKQTGMSVITNFGRIIEVVPAGQVQDDSDVEIIDATEKFMVPGYNDMHSHVLELADPAGSLALMLTEGVTGFRQMSGSPLLLERRRLGTLSFGEAAPQLLETPGAILTPFNASSEEAVRAEVRLQKKQGADFVKMGVANVSVFFAALDEGRRQGIPVLGHLQEGVDPAEATRLGLRSIEHLGPGTSMWVSCSRDEQALRAESLSRSHRIFKLPPLVFRLLQPLVMKQFEKMLVNPSAFAKAEDVARLDRALATYSEDKASELAAQFASDSSWHCPTLVRIRTQEYADAPEYEKDEFLNFLPDARVRQWRQVTEKWKALPREMRDTFRRAYPMQLRLTKLLRDAGANMIIGTDGGSYLGPGLTMRQEFRELADAGLTPLDILRMATVNAAAYLGRGDEMGVIQPGRDADMVILDKNPLDRVENLHAIVGVVRAGVYFSKAKLDSMRDEVANSRGYLH